MVRLRSRRSVRLQGFDYGKPGAYFITVCTDRRRALFGDVIDGVMQLNAVGRVVQEEWFRTAILRPRVTLDAFTIVPDHVHLLFALGLRNVDHDIAGMGNDILRRGTLQRAPTDNGVTDNGVTDNGVTDNGVTDNGVTDNGVTDNGVTVMTERFGKPTSDSIPTIIRLFKSVTTLRINQIRDTPGAPVWQRGYHEHVVRSVGEMDAIRRYVVNNARNWCHS
jgi:REP element-mobilizing transposase RayT